MTEQELVDRLPCALLQLDAAGEVVATNRAVAELLGVDPLGTTWLKLGWTEEGPPVPGGPPGWRRAAEGGLQLLGLQAPREAGGWCEVRDLTGVAERVEASASEARPCALRPVIAGLVHTLNNQLHLAMTLADQHGAPPDSESVELARRVSEMARQSAALLGTVQGLGAEGALPWSRFRLGEVLERSAALHRKAAEVVGVTLECADVAGAAAVVLGPRPDLETVLSQLTLHAIGTAGEAGRVEAGIVRREADVAVELRVGGDAGRDEGLAAILAEPSRSLGLHAAPGFVGEVDVLGPSLLAVRLAGGDVEIGHDGTHRSLRLEMPARESTT